MGFPPRISGLATIRRMINPSRVSMENTAGLFVIALHRLLCQPVGMVQATKNRLHHDLQAWWKLVPVSMESNRQVCRRLWDARAQGHVRTTGVIMHNPLVQDTSQ